MRLILAALLTLLPAMAAADGLRALTNGDEQRGWEGVGRLELGARGFCTGALITPRHVVTAAHCLHDGAASGGVRAAAEVRFLAGWRDGRAEAYRAARRIVVHPLYDHGATDRIGGLAHDLALIELDRPIETGHVAPFPVIATLGAGDEVGVVSYAHDRAERPALQEVCHVLAVQDGAVVTTCEADFGTSGAPIFVMRGGKPHVVSVVSAMAEALGRKVSIGTGPGLDVGRLMQTMAKGGDVFGVPEPRVRRVMPGTRTIGGAKFVSP